VPLVIWIPIRIGRAFGETALLLLDVKVVRNLPWRYIAALPGRNKLIGFTSGCLLLSSLGFFVGLAVPSLLRVALVIAIANVATSIIRGWTSRPKMPR
jgi:hypothetical protein